MDMVGGVYRGVEEDQQSSRGGEDGKGSGVRPGLIVSFITYLVCGFAQAPSPPSLSFPI